MHPTFILPFRRVLQEPLVLKQWLNVATPTARNITRNILKECGPIDSHALFEKTQQVTLDPNEMQERKMIYKRLLTRLESNLPQNPLHPIRSLSYLKGIVMPDLVKRGEAEKIYRRREPTSEERELLAHTKPLSLRQRKMRGAVGPGKRPPLYKDGEVHEWLWSITERGMNALPEREKSDLEYGLIYDKQFKDTESIKTITATRPKERKDEYMTDEDILQTAKKWS